MKRLIFFLTIGVFLCYKTNGQIIQNGDFLHSLTTFTNDYNLCPGFEGQGHSSLLDGDIPNWYRMHGSPEPCRGYQSCDPGNTGVIYMIDDSRIGEGIVGGYPFIANETYIIHLGIKWFYNPDDILMVAVPGARPFNGNCFEIPCGNNQGTFNGKAPAAALANGEIVLDPGRNIGLSSLSYGDNEFTFTPTKNHDWITLLPFGVGDECPLTEISADYIWITRKCKESIYIDDFPFNSNLTIEPYITSHYKEIYIGSKYGTQPTATTSGQHASFTASDFILFEDMFVASPNNGRYVIASIDEYQCDKFPFTIGSDDQGDSKPGRNTNTADLSGTDETYGKNKLLSSANMFSIYPNPTNGSFTLELPQKGSYEVNVIDMIGSTVYSSTINNEQKTTIQLDNNLPVGNYTVHINGAGIRHVEKIALMR